MYQALFQVRIAPRNWNFAYSKVGENESILIHPQLFFLQLNSCFFNFWIILKNIIIKIIIFYQNNTILFYASSFQKPSLEQANLTN